MTLLHTDTDYAAFRGEDCVGIATKFSGRGAERMNAEIVEEWRAAGYSIREMPRHEACDAHERYLRRAWGVDARRVVTAG